MLQWIGLLKGEMGVGVRRILLGASVAVCTVSLGSAAGWQHVHRYVKPTGKCAAGTEILASHYALEGRTATGAVFDPQGNTAAARSWPFGTILKITNPKTGQSVTVTINDLGPFGTAYKVGARLDLAIGAAHRIGMHAAQYVCVSLPKDDPEEEANADP